MAVQSVRQLRNRIRSTQKTAQITRTMQMVAASRLKRAQGTLRQATPYAQRMEHILDHLRQTGLPMAHPFFVPRPVRSLALVVVTSDRGLCGAYNANVLTQAEAFLSTPRAQPVQLILIGKKGADYFKSRSWPILHCYLDVAGKMDFHKISDITGRIVHAYESGEADEVHLIFSQYISAMSIRPVQVQFLGLTPSDARAVAVRTAGAVPPQGKSVQTLLEPDLAQVLERFLPEYVASKMYISLASAFTAENSARMIAMKTATDNAKEMIGRLTLQRNKVRQAAITKEILEIVTAGEALKG